MGEARKRRLKLIKEGKAEEARRPENNPTPQHLTVLSAVCTKVLEAEVLKRFELTRRETLPTLSSFLERLIIAGIASFDRAKAQQEEKDSLVKVAGVSDLAEVTRRLQAAKAGA